MITDLLTLQNQLRIFHWQTKSYAEHQAFGESYNKFSDLIDEFIEVFMGKYGVIENEDGFTIKLLNYTNKKDAVMCLNKNIDHLSSEKGLRNHLQKNDTDLFNLIDEMLSNLNKLKYLLTLS